MITVTIRPLLAKLKTEASRTQDTKTVPKIKDVAAALGTSSANVSKSITYMESTINPSINSLLIDTLINLLHERGFTDIAPSDFIQRTNF